MTNKVTDERASMREEDGVGSVIVTPTPPRRRTVMPLLILTLLAFALGVAITVWAWPQIQRRLGHDTQRTAPVPVQGLITGNGASATVRPLTADAAQMLDGRVLQLEERLNRITVEAQAASGNAARAEGLLVAFAARLRFGQAQPRAVAAIINAAREPITLADLRGGLGDVAAQVTTPSANGNWWDALEHEARELITIRKASTPSPRPQAAMDRALRYIDGGRVSTALAEVERLPGRAAADRWMQYARRYLEARRALDLIETAAILEPRQLRGTEGTTVAQTSPLAP
jgi:outer membrane murein-binding lipoprotein Lpp